MELRQFALRVVESAALADKLTAPESLTDRQPGPARVVDRPERSPLLAFPRQRLRDRLPGMSQLAEPRARGELLHRFANHELLALEIMAATLLRFPDAPRAFRLGIAATMVEEQRHLGLYLGRMAALGVEVGAVPVNDHFWRACADLRDPLDYVRRMSLTFEQANLDFTRAWRSRFAHVGDHETSEILRRVYDDELGHVRAGLVWLRRWKDPSTSDFRAWADGLPLALTPARARAPDFDREGRRAAGFDEEFIDGVEFFGGSRGRPPRVFLFNPGVEEELGAGQSARATSSPVRGLAEDLAPLFSFVASPGDVVVAPRPPRSHWRRQLSEAGFVLPEFVSEVDALRERRIGGLEPWGWGPVMAQKLAALIGSLPAGTRRWHPGQGALADKVAALSWQRAVAYRLDAGWALAPEGVVVDTVELGLDALARGWVVKAPFSSAGRERLRGEASVAARNWLVARLARHGRLRAEPWRDRLLDFSVHFDAAANGLRPVGICRFLADARGQFTGTLPGRWTAQLDGEMAAFLSPRAGRLRSLTDALVAVLTPVVVGLDYRGPVGIDAMVVRTDAGLKIDPLVELNPRWTMGRISLALGRRVHPAARARWEFRSAASLAREGLDGEAWAMPCDRSPRLRDGLLADGVLATTDPAGATTMLTRLVVEPPPSRAI
jgi:uncharacterized ferritin-like protein (DUF455 family)